MISLPSLATNLARSGVVSTGANRPRKYRNVHRRRKMMLWFYFFCVSQKQTPIRARDTPGSLMICWGAGCARFHAIFFGHFSSAFMGSSPASTEAHTQMRAPINTWRGLSGRHLLVHYFPAANQFLIDQGAHLLCWGRLLS